MESGRRLDRTTIVVAILIFCIAFIVRMPSCYESFWIDELHSAWTVWGNLADVSPRAREGHQSPLYFTALWVWKQLAGDGEVGLRISSVLATALASGALTVMLSIWTRHVIAGAAGGMILALERNAIFFGTELRPYAWVILFATIAIACFLRLTAVRSRSDAPRLWATLVITILLSTLVQPTSIGVLVLLPLALLLRWSCRDLGELKRVGMMDVILLLAAMATLLALWRSTLGESWQDRSQWSAFGTAKTLRQLVDIWDWTWLLVAPLVIAIVASFASNWRGRENAAKDLLGPLISLSLIAAIGTFLYWFVAWMELAPIWHRRYFVAVLPVFATVTGGAVGIVAQGTEGFGWSKRNRQIITTIVACILVFGLGLYQQTIQRLRYYPVALAVRGEDWRGAIDWADRNANSSDQVYLDPDLIESAALFRFKANGKPGPTLAIEIPAPATRPSYDYLRFAVRGPYQLEHPVSVCDLDSGLTVASDLQFLNPIPSSQGRTLILIRRSKAHLPVGVIGPDHEVIPFGRVSVIVRPSTIGSLQLK